MILTIFTPTYNRAHTLSRLYESLCQQDFFDFEWLIVDDGSTDQTRELITSFNTGRFPVRYYFQKNGGKHRAINKGVGLAQGRYFWIVDSDDFLMPDIMLALKRYLEDIDKDIRFCGITTLRVYSDGSPIGNLIPFRQLDTDFLSFRVKYKARGDYAEIISTSVLREFPFPEFDGENFCTEAVVWNRIAVKYLSRYINFKTYVCEYLAEGLTDSYEKNMCKNVQASLLYEKELYLSPLVPFKSKLGSLVQYWKYYKYHKGKLDISLTPSLSMYLYYPFVFIAWKIKHTLFSWKK